MSRVYRIADLFCGAGGSSTGAIRAIEELGGKVDLVAVNLARIAWAAGLIEGEGCILLTKGRTSAHDGTTANAYSVRVVMTDRDVLARLPEIFGVGQIHDYSDSHSRLGHKPTYRWEVRRREEVRSVLSLIRPFMGARRGAQIDRVLAALDQTPAISSSERVRRSWLTRRALADRKAS